MHRDPLRNLTCFIFAKKAEKPETATDKKPKNRSFSVQKTEKPT